MKVNANDGERKWKWSLMRVNANERTQIKVNANQSERKSKWTQIKVNVNESERKSKGTQTKGNASESERKWNRTLTNGNASEGDANEGELFILTWLGWQSKWRNGSGKTMNHQHQVLPLIIKNIRARYGNIFIMNNTLWLFIKDKSWLYLYDESATNTPKNKLSNFRP